MPFWAVIYVFSLILSAVFTIYISRNKSLLYMISQILSGIFAAAFFFIYYNVVPYPPSIATPMLMLIFIIFQEVWVNKELYDMVSLRHFPKKLHKTMLVVVPLSAIIFIAPVIWIISQVFKHYFIP